MFLGKYFTNIFFFTRPKGSGDIATSDVSCPLYNFNRSEYFDDTSQFCRTGHDDVSRTKMRALALILFSFLPFDAFYAYSCPLCNLNTLWNIINILHSYVEQVMTMCRVQNDNSRFHTFLSYFPLMVSDAVSCPLRKLKTVRNTIMILHSYVEQVMTMCHVQE